MKKKIYLSVVLLIVGICIGYFIPNKSEGDSFSEEVRFDVGQFTNPLLECEVGSDTIASKKEDFTSDMENFVVNLKKEENLTDFSVYFRDMNNGPVVGVNQDFHFSPASLLKVPTLIAYLSWSEVVPGALEKTYTYESLAEKQFTPLFIPPRTIVIGETYTAKELLERMIIYSDNEAYFLLQKHLPSKYKKDFYSLVGVNPKIIDDTSATISVKQYSIFFRILFNSSFLSRTNSEYALSLLSKTEFTEGLRSGVPEYVLISHKFGERKTQDGLQQLHDCGIIYYPNHPYLLCVMSRGKDLKNLTDSIQKTSKFVYEILKEQYPD